MVRPAPRGRAPPGRPALSGSGWASRNRAKRQASVALPVPCRPPSSQAWCRRPCPVAVEQLGLGPGLAEAASAVSRGCGAGSTRSLSGTPSAAPHGVPPAASRSSATGSEPGTNGEPQGLRRPRRRLRPASTTRQRSGSRSALRQEGAAQALVVGRGLPLEPVRRPRRRGAPGPVARPVSTSRSSSTVRSGMVVAHGRAARARRAAPGRRPSRAPW